MESCRSARIKVPIHFAIQLSNVQPIGGQCPKLTEALSLLNVAFSSYWASYCTGVLPIGNWTVLPESCLESGFCR